MGISTQALMGAGQQYLQNMSRKQQTEQELQKLMLLEHIKQQYAQQQQLQQMRMMQQIMGGGQPGQGQPGQVGQPGQIGQPGMRQGQVGQVGMGAGISQGGQGQENDYTWERSVTMGPTGPSITMKRVLSPQAKMRQKLEEERATLGIKGLPGESAGKLTMLSQALSDLDMVEKLLFPKGAGGQERFARGLATAANIPGGSLPGIPSVGFGSKARIISSKMNNALEAKLRIETGAAATQEEFQRLQQRFGVTVFDTAASAKDKIRRLKAFMKNAIVTIDPTGRFIYKTGSNQLDRELNMGDGKPDPLGLR